MVQNMIDIQALAEWEPERRQSPFCIGDSFFSLLKPSFVSRYFSQENEPQADTSHRIIYNKKIQVISSYLMQLTPPPNTNKIIKSSIFSLLLRTQYPKLGEETSLLFLFKIQSKQARSHPKNLVRAASSRLINHNVFPCSSILTLS